MYENSQQRWQVDGKFFRVQGRRVAMKCITFGPFPGGYSRAMLADLPRVADCGANAIRVYEMPDETLLDAAAAAGLAVFAGLRWGQGMNFRDEPRHFTAAKVALEQGLASIADHPALVGVYVANEIPADMVRWMGPAFVRDSLEQLISLGRTLAPQLLFAYANYPSTEYVEPENADFTAFNVFLEHETSLRNYLPRLHHLAGDRPVVISEFGLDTQRHGAETQAATFRWGLRAMQEAGMAGMTVYAWSDRWWNAGHEVLDWSFGLVDRSGKPKASWHAVKEAFSPDEVIAADTTMPLVSVIICTRNGASRIERCLRAAMRLRGRVEVIVVDDGSTDQTAEIVKKAFPQVQLLSIAPQGLSAARNAGAAAAQGTIFAYTDDDCEVDEDWVLALWAEFARGDWAAVGGPNIPPPAETAIAALLNHAEGAPTHVMLNDKQAEHLPGCNMAIRAEAFHRVGGFDVRYQTAGDDVDFCWRLSDAGLRMGFAATAFVWHQRRQTLRTYIRQQRGYGKAEALLMVKHPHRFYRGQGASWQGFVYQGGPLRAVASSVIYYGVMGMNGYQGTVQGMIRTRPLPAIAFASCIIKLISRIASWGRRWHRCRGNRHVTQTLSSETKKLLDCDLTKFEPVIEFFHWSASGNRREGYLAALKAQGWHAGGVHDRYDLCRDGVYLLMASEQGEERACRTWIRCIGDLSIDELRRFLVLHDDV